MLLERSRQVFSATLKDRIRSIGDDAALSICEDSQVAISIDFNGPVEQEFAGRYRDLTLGGVLELHSIVKLVRLL